MYIDISFYFPLYYTFMKKYLMYSIPYWIRNQFVLSFQYYLKIIVYNSYLCDREIEKKNGVQPPMTAFSIIYFQILFSSLSINPN